jgi:methylthioribose-1-phosphate isomerase
MKLEGQHHRTLYLRDDGTLRLLDQRALPFRVAWVDTRAPEETAAAIREMVVRGAGAIGAAAAAGAAQAAFCARESAFAEDLAAGVAAIRAARPTARNLFYGVDVVLAAIEAAGPHPAQARAAALDAARWVADDDAASCAAIGEHGSALVQDGASVHTHCNAGWLAFVDWGSALAPIYAAHRDGRRVHVWVDETRPRSQGAKLTAFELGQAGVAHDILPDGASGLWMRQGRSQLVIVGADRIAANGDVANKVGTYLLALAAAAHGVPFYVAAPTSTLDGATPDGDGIPIEERAADEVLFAEGVDADGAPATVRTAAHGSGARNPAFDITPAALVRGIITERGVIPARADAIARVLRPTSAGGA